MIAEETVNIPHHSPFQTLWNMVIKPRAAFTYLRESGSRAWWLAATLSVVTTIILVLVTAPITARISREAIRASMESQTGPGIELTEEQMAQAESFSTNPIFTMVIPIIGSILGLGFSWLVWTGLLHLLSTITGGSNTFGQIWQVTVWAWLPFSVRNIIQAVYSLVSGEVIQRQGLSGLVMPEVDVAQMITAPPSATQMMLSTLLARLDLYLIWHLALLITGVAVMTRFSGRKAALITLGVWIVLTLLTVLLAVAPNMLTAGMG